MDKVQQAFALQQSAQTSPAQLQEANKWLEHFQGTTEAWQVVDQLLRQPAENGTASAAHVFAAQTMRTKIQYDWAELPAQSHESLRSSLLEHVIRFGQVGPGSSAAPSSAAPQLRSSAALLQPLSREKAMPMRGLVSTARVVAAHLTPSALCSIRRVRSPCSHSSALRSRRSRCTWTRGRPWCLT